MGLEYEIAREVLEWWAKHEGCHLSIHVLGSPNHHHERAVIRCNDCDERIVEFDGR